MKKPLLVLLFIPLVYSGCSNKKDAPVEFFINQNYFNSIVDKNKLPINDYFILEFQIRKEGNKFNPPKFGDFKVINGPNQSLSNSWKNGKRNFLNKYSYVLSPKRKGKLSIGEASVIINGKLFKTNPLVIDVNEKRPLTRTESINKGVNEVRKFLPYDFKNGIIWKEANNENDISRIYVYEVSDKKRMGILYQASMKNNAHPVLSMTS